LEQDVATINTTNSFTEKKTTVLEKHGSDGKHFIGAVEIRAHHQHFGHSRIQRKLAHQLIQLCQISIIVKRCRCVEKL
jgi:hypothetical protein